MPIAKHHPCGRFRYQRGCRCADCISSGDAAPHRDCPTCVKANREYARRTARLASVAPLAPPTEESQTPDWTVHRPNSGFVVPAVLGELETLPAAKQMTGHAAAALAMARLLDDQTAGPQHPGAAGQLRAILKEIRVAQSAAKVSKLQSMRDASAS